MFLTAKPNPPEKSSNTGCVMHCCGFILFIIMCVILLGALAMFFISARLHDELYRYVVF